MYFTRMLKYYHPIINIHVIINLNVIVQIIIIIIILIISSVVLSDMKNLIKLLVNIA